MPQVVTQQIVQGPFAEPPFQSHGKMIEVTAWIVNALVDGAPMQNLKLRAFSKKVHWAVTPGNIIQCEPIKTHKGQMECKIITPSDQNGLINTQQQAVPQPQQQPYQPAQQSYTPPAQAYTPPAQQYTPPAQRPMPVSSGVNPYTLQELEAVLKYSFDVAVGMTEDTVQQNALAGLLMIQACKERIRVPAQAVNARPQGQNNPQMQAVLDKTTKDQIWETIYAKGLGERISNCQAAITEPLLAEWWRQANQDANIFAIRLNHELQVLENGGE